MIECYVSPNTKYVYKIQRYIFLLLANQSSTVLVTQPHTIPRSELLRDYFPRSRPHVGNDQLHFFLEIPQPQYISPGIHGTLALGSVHIFASGA